jgi:predicted nucleic acid-binding protein
LTNQNFPKCILVDANFLIASIHPKTSSDDRAKIDYFFIRAEKAKSKIIIPMPAIAEYLVLADTAAIETLNRLERKAFIVVAPFDRSAAFECALLDRAAIGSGDKKDGALAPWQKIKIDRQIVATGKAHGASLVISGDDGVRNNALRVGMLAKTIQELELPESARQAKLELITKKK